MTSTDLEWLTDIVVKLLQAPTRVPAGDTQIQPGDLRIARAVEQVVLPWIRELSPAEVRAHPLGDVAARFGPAADDGVLVQTYIVSQHANLMSSSTAGTFVDAEAAGGGGARVLGPGASQNKGAMASALAAIRGLPRDLDRPVWLAVNTEGKSSHGGSRRILDDLGVTASAGILAVGTDLQISLGNRGRVDVEITVSGESCHSSQPWLGVNPIDAASDVVLALRSTALPPADPTLGPATATVYQFACHPIAPHTIPSVVSVMVDRRLLPGDSPAAAVDDIRRHLAARLGTDEVAVAAGEFMLPAAVADDAPVVTALLDGLRQVTGEPGRTLWSQNTFDAGYACSKGIPTVMFGPGKRRFGGSALTGEDSISVSDMRAAADVLQHALQRLCTGT